jgi:hypothetical protein
LSKAKPGQPRNARAARVGSKVRVTWDSPSKSGGASVTSYQVQASPGGRVCIARASRLSCEFSNLSAGVQYKFKIVAKNKNGSGPSTSASTSASTTFNQQFQRGK